MTSIHVRVYVRLYELMSHITHMSHSSPICHVAHVNIRKLHVYLYVA